MSKKRDSDRAHAKGQKDYVKERRNPTLNPITSLFHPAFDPPAGQERAYRDGWRNAKRGSR